MIRALGLTLLALVAPVAGQDLALDWSEVPDRTWVGPELWANRLQDWCVKNGRLECRADEPRLALRTVHVLTHRLQPGRGAFSMRAQLGLSQPDGSAPDSAGGFLIGVGGRSMDWRSAALVHAWSGPGAGLFVGVTGEGELLVRDNEDGAVLWRYERPVSRAGLDLRVMSHRLDGAAVELLVLDGERTCGSLLVPPRRLVGGVALVSHPGTQADGRAPGRWWFQNLELLGGDVIDCDPRRTFGPIAGTQYTLSRGILKLTAQLLPIGPDEDHAARLELRPPDGAWTVASEVEVVEPGFTATFRHELGQLKGDLSYRVVWGEHEWKGTIRRDPLKRDELVLAGMNCNHNNSHRLGSKETDWTQQVWFPHADLVRNVALHEPDLLFFAGDQIYEGKSPSFPDLAHIELDYLYKWYLWVWAFRELTRDIPAVTIPDDHDVYQGNVWGQGGRRIGRDNEGGYVRPAEFVNMVERTQTSHLPDPFDPTPIEQGIGTYHTSLRLGRVDFAILEDRKFKSGPAGKGLPPTGTKRPDHVEREDFDPRAYDREDLVLLGERQLVFLEQWAADWRGVEMKAVLSQSPFANLATHHGAELQYLQADLDSNGWPQSGRDRALRKLRKAFAFHVSGDQHLATLVQHGIDDFGDAGWSYCVPSVANFYPRAWRPEGDPLGDHLDGLGNRVTVHAVANPGGVTGRQPADLYDKMPGYGIVRMNLAERTITFECWPRHAAPGGEQYAGWPRTIDQLDNFAAEPRAWLPQLRNARAGLAVRVVDEASGALVYGYRLRGATWWPPAPATPGPYTVHVGDPEQGDWVTHSGVEASAERRGALESDF